MMEFSKLLIFQLSRTALTEPHRFESIFFRSIPVTIKRVDRLRSGYVLVPFQTTGWNSGQLYLGTTWNTSECPLSQWFGGQGRWYVFLLLYTSFFVIPQDAIRALILSPAPLSKHLQTHNVEFMQFAFRWMNCLLMRELSVKNTIRMWDTYLVRLFLSEEMPILNLHHSPKVPTRSPSSISTSVVPFLQVGVRSYGIWTSR
jgi:Rab-GTPase-TBC domain